MGSPWGPPISEALGAQIEARQRGQGGFSPSISTAGDAKYRKARRRQRIHSPYAETACHEARLLLMFVTDAAFPLMSPQRPTGVRGSRCMANFYERLALQREAPPAATIRLSFKGRRNSGRRSQRLSTFWQNFSGNWIRRLLGSRLVLLGSPSSNG